jgi:hypothetical protein
MLGASRPTSCRPATRSSTISGRCAQSLETPLQAVALVHQLADGTQLEVQQRSVLLGPVDVAVAEITRDDKPVHDDLDPSAAG